ncbi:unnamed protein product [Angiostrongylus costaricensis]|uniref:Cytidine deaminase n=1 Tax=Angiostrongylus costaricensis TaxID=334426 RepID=A0A158PD47_ANGCS|nr:unnamed protein product [Angiostrongylus costaricensis]
MLTGKLKRSVKELDFFCSFYKTTICSPYSKFPVGAALLTADDTVIVGANCENASYGGTICAERNAITTALSRGFRQFKTIAVVTQLEEPATPCGMCRQFLIEFGDCRVIMGSSKGDKVNETSLAELLPDAFTPANLETHTEQSSKDD